MSTLLVFNRVYRLEIQSVTLVFSTGFATLIFSLICCLPPPLCFAECVVDISDKQFTSVNDTVYIITSVVTDNKLSPVSLFRIFIDFMKQAINVSLVTMTPAIINPW
jgi:hypothetical protein